MKNDVFNVYETFKIDSPSNNTLTKNFNRDFIGHFF